MNGKDGSPAGKRPPQPAFSRHVPPYRSSHTGKLDPRARIEVKDLDWDRGSFTFDARRGICISRFDTVIRARAKQPIKDSALILFYSGGRELRPETLVRGDETVYYRVVTGYENVGIRLQAEDEGNDIQPSFAGSLIQDIETGLTLGDMRSRLANALGVADVNRVVISAWGGLRRGPLEGNQWEARQVRGWLSSNIIFNIYPDRRYLVVRGLGREYIYHPKSAHEPNAVVRYVKSWIHTRIIKGVHQRGASSLAFRTRQIQLRQDVKVVEGFSPIEWGSAIDFTLPRDLAEAFSSDEAWLLQPTETCAVCCEAKRPSDIPQQITSSCTHSPALCKGCLSQWIRSSLDDLTWDRLKCPECPARLAYQDVRLFSDPHVFERYDSLAAREAFKNIADFQWCLGAKCESGQIHAARCPKFKCYACGSKQCVKHSIPWHKGETCEEYDQRNKRRQKDDRKSEKTIKDTSKRCPECKSDVHKYAGCNHVTCTCSADWCYICLARYYRTAEGFLRCQHNTGCTERDIFADLGFIPGMAPPPPPPRPPWFGGPPPFHPRPRFGEAGGVGHGRVPPIVPAPPLFAEPPPQVREEMENARRRTDNFMDAATAAATAMNGHRGRVEHLADQLQDLHPWQRV